MSVGLPFAEVLAQILFDKNSSCHHACHQNFFKSPLERAKTKREKDKNDDQILRRSKCPSLSIDQTQSCIFCFKVSTSNLMHLQK